MKKTMFLLSVALVAAACPLLANPTVTIAPNGGWDAAWSPDGSTIAFTSCSPHGIPNLWVIKSNKTGLRQMTFKGAHEPLWLADGKTIVFGTVRSGETVFMSIGEGDEPGSEKRFEALPAGAENPVWSPDGSLVAYGVASKDGISRDLKFARTSGGGATGLTSNFWCREWTWSPDGSTIAFVVGKSTGTSLWTANPATKEVKLFYKGYCSAPAYSPDGTKLALARPDVRSGFKPVVVDLSTGVDKLIGVRSFNGQKIIWSPDGNKLFFESSMKSEPAVWCVGVDGKNVTRVTPEGTPSMIPALSPDGKHIVCQVMAPESFGTELAIYDTSGAMLTKLTGTTRPSYWSPVWRPDGKQIAFLSDINHVTELFLGSPDGRASKVVTAIKYPGTVEFSWFADGSRLLMANGGRLLTIDPTGGKAAAKPLPNVTTQVQGPKLSGNEVVVTEWDIRDAAIAMFALDGSDKRRITQKPQAPPAQPEQTESSPAEHTGAGPSDEADAEVGNPHSDLGLMGPQADISSKMPPVIDLWPAVSTDGKSVVFVRDDQVWLVNSDGTGERQITAFAPAEGTKHTVMSPNWSPDGNAIVFTAFSSGGNKLTLEIWTCTLDAGSQRLIHSEGVHTEYGVFYFECTNPAIFMPDGKKVLFTSLSNDELRIVSMSTDGSDIRELVQAPSSFPALDASGKKLAYVDLSDQQERIWVVDLETGRRTGPLRGK